jgi:hypothetical protein
VLFAALGSVRSWSLARKFDQIGGYILEVEEYFLKGRKEKDPEGWEKYQRVHRKSFVKGSGFVFWAILLVVTLAVAYSAVG